MDYRVICLDQPYPNTGPFSAFRDNLTLEENHIRSGFTSAKIPNLPLSQDGARRWMASWSSALSVNCWVYVLCHKSFGWSGESNGPWEQFYRDYQKSRNHVFADDAWNSSGSLRRQPKPQVYGLMGSGLWERNAPCFLFSNVVIPPPVNGLKRDELLLLLWCIICNFLCIAGRDRSCRLTLHQQLELLVYITVSFLYLSGHLRH